MLTVTETLVGAVAVLSSIFAIKVAAIEGKFPFWQMNTAILSIMWLMK